MYKKDIKKDKLGFFEHFSIGFTMYRQNFGIILVLGGLLVLPMCLIPLIFPFEQLDYSYILYMGYDALSTKMLFALLTKSFISLIFTALLTGAATVIADKSSNEEKAGFSDVIAGSLGKILSYIVVCFLYVFSITIGILMFFIPGIAFAIAFNFCFNAHAIGNNGILNTFKDSYRVIKGRVFMTLLFLASIMVVHTAVYYIAATAVYALVPFIFLNPVLSIVFDVISSTLLIYFHIVTAVWFVNKFYLSSNESDTAVLK